MDTLIHPRRDAKRRTEGNLRLGSIVLLSWLTAIACGSGTTPAPAPTGARDVVSSAVPQATTTTIGCENPNSDGDDQRCREAGILEGGMR